jgi:hypothetical protein
LQVLGASTAAFAAPVTFVYARHAAHHAPDRLPGRIAFVLVCLEALACLVFAGGMAWSRIG